MSFQSHVYVWWLKAPSYCASGPFSQVGHPPAACPHIDHPTPIPELAWIGVTKLTAGDSHSVALSSDGELWCWGDNREGQLGIGPPSCTPEPPAQVELLFDTFLTGVAAGARHTLALTEAGEVYAWGSNSCGQLGTSAQAAEAGPATPLSLLPDSNGEASGVPRKVPGLPPCSQLAASNISAAVSASGRLFLWGSHPALNPGEAGGQGCSIQEVCWLRPKRVSGIALGTSHAVVVTDDQSMYAWGELARTLGHPQLSEAVAVWATDAALLPAAKAERQRLGVAGPPSAPLTASEQDDPSRSSSLPVGDQDERVASPLDLTGCLGASPERISASPGCSVVLLQPPPGTSPGEDAVPLLRLHRQLAQAGQTQVWLPGQRVLAARLRVFNERVKLVLYEADTPPPRVGQLEATLLAGEVPGEGSVGMVVALLGDGSEDSPSTGMGRVPDPTVIRAEGGNSLSFTRSSAAAPPCPPSLSSSRSSSSQDCQPPTAAPHGGSPALSPPRGHQSLSAACEALAADDRRPLVPREEPVVLLAAGDCHTVCLCAASQYAAPPSVLHHTGVLLISQVWQRES